jgi:hypothetical protein
MSKAKKEAKKGGKEEAKADGNDKNKPSNNNSSEKLQELQKLKAQSL